MKVILRFYILVFLFSVLCFVDVYDDDDDDDDDDSFCGMVELQRALSRDHCQRFSQLQISDTPLAGFEPEQNLSSGFVELRFAVVITAIPRRVKLHYNRDMALICDNAEITLILKLPPSITNFVK